MSLFYGLATLTAYSYGLVPHFALIRAISFHCAPYPIRAHRPKLMPYPHILKGTTVFFLTELENCITLRMCAALSSRRNSSSGGSTPTRWSPAVGWLTRRFVAACTTTVEKVLICLKTKFNAAPRNSRNPCGAGQTGPGHWQTQRRGTGQKVWVWRRLFQRKPVLVATHEAQHLVPFWWTLLQHVCKGN